MQPSDSDDPAIEALRGVAALLVVLTHYMHFLTLTPGLWAFASTGVDLFFVISGFVFAPYFSVRPLQPAPFFVRRFFRMYPLYVCALLVYVALKPAGTGAWAEVPAHLLMGHTLQSVAIASYYNPAFWSLPPELEFYLLLPLLAPLCRRFGLGVLLAAGLAVHLLLVALSNPANPEVTTWVIAMVHAPGLLIEFLLGVLSWRLLGVRPRDLLLAMSSLILVFAMFLFSQHLPSPGLANGRAGWWVGGNIGLTAAAGYALMLAALAGIRLCRKPRWQPLCLWAGRLSYGTYLLHNAAPPVLSRLAPGLTGLPALLACLSLTLLAAWAAHVFIEAPSRRFGRRLAARLSTSV